MNHFKINKISFGILSLMISLQIQASTQLNATTPISKHLVHSSDVVVDGLYQIQFNKEFNSLVEVSSDSVNIYLPLDSLDQKIFTKFDFDSVTTTKDNKRFIAINKSMIHSIDNNDMTMEIVFNSSLFKNNNAAKKINYVERSIDRIDTKNVVNYFNNNYQIYVEDGRDIMGYLNTTYSNKNYWSLQNKMLYNSEKFIRIGSVYKKEFRDKSTLQIGDIIEDGIGQLSSSNGFGLKYSTNYFTNNLNSNINESLPQFSVNGFSLTPSMFNLYSTSNALISSEINSGNYNIVMPYNNGYGTYSGYVRDYLGNIQQFNIPYYNSNKLVKANGFEYSLSAATIRKNPYTKSFDYDKPFISGVAKYGVNNNWTQDFSFHHSTYFKNIYTGANFYIDPRFGLFQFGVNYNGDSQRLYNVGWENYSNSPLTFKFNASLSDNKDGFCMQYIGDCIKKQNRYFIGYKLPANLGNLSFQHLDEKKKLYEYQSSSLNWAKSINNRFSMVFMFEHIKNNKTNKDNRFLMLLSYSLDDRWSGSVNHQNRDNYHSSQFRIARREDRANPQYGYGYLSVRDSTYNKNPDFNLNYFANLDHFSYNIQANSRNNEFGSKVGIRGSALYVPEDKSLTFNKDVTGVIIVDTDQKSKDQEPIEIYHQNKLVGKTDNDGKYIIVKGSPYSTEKVELNLKNLPLDRNFDEFKYQIVVPEYGAAKLNFKQRQSDRDIYIDNLPEGTIFKIGDSDYVVGKQGLSTVDKEGIATFSSDFKNCKFTVDINTQHYTCE
jgi:outer membrane usher protein FimD/PapC